MVRAEELPGEADVDRSTPILGPDVFDSAGRSGDAGVVDQNVEAAERALDLGEKAQHVRFRRDVCFRRARVAMSAAKFGEKIVGNVADMDPRAPGDEQVADRPPDPRRAGCHQNTQPLSKGEDVSAIAHESSACSCPLLA